MSTYVEKKDRRSNGYNNKMNEGKKTQKVDLEQIIINAEREASKIAKTMEPDNMMYWRFVQAAWSVQCGNQEEDNINWKTIVSEEEDSTDSEDDDEEDQIHLSYPKGTKLEIRTHPSGNQGKNRVRLSKALQLAEQKGQYELKEFKKCRDYFIARHNEFIANLPDKARHIYNGMLQDNKLRKKYKKCEGYQKTNMVFEMLREKLYTRTNIDSCRAEFYYMTQRQSQTNEHYISVLEKKREHLKQMGVIIDDFEMKARVLNSLNLTNHRHASYLQSERMDLEEIKQFLYNKDKDELKYQNMKRKSREREYGNNKDGKRRRYENNTKTSKSRDYKKNDVICYKCNKPGHLANECTSNNNSAKQDKGKKIASVFEKLHSDESDSESEHMNRSNDSSDESS